MAGLQGTVLPHRRRAVRVAAIDVGTNSTRLLVADEGVPGSFRTLERRTMITRLGQGVEARRRLASEALERTFAIVADYAAVCGEYAVERLRVTGTSAVRDADNRDEFFAGVEALTGVRPEMLSGEEEARATFLGACFDLAPGGATLVVDIGGGSTELIVGEDEPERMISLDIGCVRLFEKHLRSDPPAAEEIEALGAEAVSELGRAKPELAVPVGARLVGVAGTVTQLALLKTGLTVYDPDVTHHAVLSHGDVRMLSRRLASLPIEARKQVRGLDPGRADVIVAGAEILLAVMETFDAAEVLVSEKDILDGLVLQLLASA
jgi:exopolyphosphatase/guanosine-5'-triphosphate,3'-diphosphate pyrophosphatase